MCELKGNLKYIKKSFLIICNRGETYDKKVKPDFATDQSIDSFSEDQHRTHINGSNQIEHELNRKRHGSIDQLSSRNNKFHTF